MILGSRLGFDIDMRRFNKPIKKIVRGLFFKKSKTPLPGTYRVDVFPGNDFWSSPGFSEWLVSWEPLAGCGDRQFLMRCTRDASDPNITAWLLQFYGEVAFLAWTLPRETAVRTFA